ncbi:hypothetical protein LINGRAHAP2_LOCUS33125 [Linum grandiflorum]
MSGVVSSSFLCCSNISISSSIIPISLTLLMSELRLFIFRCGHLMMLSSRHLRFSTVSPTFISLAARVIGMSKYFCMSSISGVRWLFGFVW